MRENKGITLIALVVTIVVLLILAGVSISMLMGENGIITQAQNAKKEQSHSAVSEAISMKYNEYQMEKDIPSSNVLANFFDYLIEKQYIDETGKVNVEKVIGEKQSLGNGTGTKDVYKIIEEENKYVLKYYNSKGKIEEDNLWSVSKPSNEQSNVKTITIKDTTGYGLEELIIQYEEGMTWQDYINSKYNTDDAIIIDEDGYVVLKEIMLCRISSDSSTDSEGRFEKSYDLIDTNRNYRYSGPG